MTKNNKLLLISVALLIVIIVIIIVVFFIKNDDKEKTDHGDLAYGGTDDVMEVFEGEILEIKEDNTIVVEVTVTSTNLLDNGDKITMKVGKIQASSDSEYDIEHEMQTSDNISTQFWKKDLETVDGGYYLDLEKIGSTLNIHL